jgi:hypothetical protein
MAGAIGGETAPLRLKKNNIRISLIKNLAKLYKNRLF